LEASCLAEAKISFDEYDYRISQLMDDQLTDSLKSICSVQTIHQQNKK